VKFDIPSPQVSFKRHVGIGHKGCGIAFAVRPAGALCMPRIRQNPDHNPRPMAAADSNILKLAPDVATPAYRTAPHNIEAEQSLLGAILVNKDAFYRFSDSLEPKHLFEPIHQTIYETAGSLIRAGKI